MVKQITLEEALKLVSFYHTDACGWGIHTVNGTVKGNVKGDVGGNVHGVIGGHVNGSIVGSVVGDVFGNVVGDVKGDVFGDVKGDVKGKINGRNWAFIETPKDKLQRLIEESGNQELIDTFNQMENNS